MNAVPPGFEHVTVKSAHPSAPIVGPVPVGVTVPGVSVMSPSVQVAHARITGNFDSG